MKTIEVSDQIAQEIETLTRVEIDTVLVRAAGEFLDATPCNMPPGEKLLIHAMTGRMLKVQAIWSDSGPPSDAGS